MKVGRTQGLQKRVDGGGGDVGAAYLPHIHIETVHHIKRKISIER